MLLSLSLSQIVNLTNAFFHIGSACNTQQAMAWQPAYLSTDSRHIVYPKQSLFIALQGPNHNGHLFIEEAYQKQIRFFLVAEQPLATQNYPDAVFLCVNNTLQALQQIAAAHRALFQLPVLGITGSNGKTVVKEWLYQCLSNDFSIARSPKSYNSQVGVPLSVWQIKEHHNLAIIEAGISQPNEMEKLAAIIKPTIGLLTNIGDAHNEGFANHAHKTTEKLQLFKQAQTVLYCANYTIITTSWEATKQNPQNAGAFKAQLFTWANEEMPYLGNPDWLIKLVTEPNNTPNTTLIQGQFRQKSTRFKIPFTDPASVENALHVAFYLLVVGGYEIDIIEQKLANLQPVAMRLSVLAGINQCTLIDDVYSSDPQSLQSALQLLAQQGQNAPRTVILSDMATEQDDFYEHSLPDLLTQFAITKFMAIGPKLARYKKTIQAAIETKQNKNKGKGVAFFYPDVNEFLNHRPDFNKEIILIKGARSFAFERIVQALALKTHNTRLEINLNALAHNLHVFRRQLKSSTKIMVMIKALGYGSGSHEVAQLLQFARADYLGVAYPDEGIALRQAGVQLPILVMNAHPATYNMLIQYGLEPEIYSFDALNQWLQAAQSINNKALPPKIHLKLDTGMHRLGFDLADTPTLLAWLAQHKQIVTVAGLMTHLAASDEPQHDAFTQEQIAIFCHFCQQVRAVLGYKLLCHALNTSGIARFAQQAQFDMVRLGIGLYGIEPAGVLQHELMVVSSLKTHISQIKTLAPGQTVGYGRRGQVLKHSRIGTIGLGYADGFPRRLGNGNGAVWVGGALAPIIGNVCMDMTMIDLTHLPHVTENEEVEIFGSNLPVQEVAKWLQTIAYEVFTNVAGRVKRIYFWE